MKTLSLLNPKHVNRSCCGFGTQLSVILLFAITQNAGAKEDYVQAAYSEHLTQRVLSSGYTPMTRDDAKQLISQLRDREVSPKRNYERFKKGNERGLNVKKYYRKGFRVFDEDGDGFVNDREMDIAMSAFREMAQNSEHTKLKQELSAIINDISPQEREKINNLIIDSKIKQLLGRFDDNK